MPDRRGDWMQTFTGRQVWPLDPRPEDVCIEDIAHSLALQCRYAGHVRVHYSVAEHSVRGLAAVCPKRRRPESSLARDRQLSREQNFLMHDAAEAYLVDLPRPLKRDLCCAWYARVERAWRRAISWRFGIGYDDLRSTTIADDVMLATEQRDLMSPPPAPWSALPRPLPERIEPWGPERAEARFLEEFNRLFPGGRSD